MLSEILPYAGVVGSITAFLWAVTQYIDSKRREERRLRFDQFNRLIIWTSGRAEDGRMLTAFEQLSAIYQIARFRDYQDVYEPILLFLKKTLVHNYKNSDEERLSDFVEAINFVIRQK